jgi:hypothetical protein
VQSLSKRDVLLILKWKLGRIKDSNAETVNDNRMEAINEAVRNASQADRRIAALEALQKISGIGLATATAILTVCYPNDFTIIDWRVLEILDLYPSRLAKAKRKRHSADDWTAADYMREYLPNVKAYSERWSCTLRDADRALWGLSVDQRIEKIIAKCKQPLNISSTGQRQGVASAN